MTGRSGAGPGQVDKPMTEESQSLPFKGLLVEGTSGVGKSTLIDALLRRHAQSTPPRKIRTLVHLAQSHTYGPLARPENAGTLTVAENQQHLGRIVATIEWLQRCVQGEQHNRPWCFVVLDTLHLTQCVRPGIVQWSDVQAFDHRLAALGFKLLFLQAAPQAIYDRGITPRIDQQFIREYAQKFGRTHQEIHQHFVQEQEVLAGLFERSAMLKLRIENDLPVNNSLEKAYRFWTEDPEETCAQSA
jgi:GTPase SAR1 family protein